MPACLTDRELLPSTVYNTLLALSTLCGWRDGRPPPGVAETIRAVGPDGLKVEMAPPGTSEPLVRPVFRLLGKKLHMNPRDT
jgi:hypothetical protein